MPFFLTCSYLVAVLEEVGRRRDSGTVNAGFRLAPDVVAVTRSA